MRSDIQDRIKKGKPYKRISYIAMLLGFHNCVFTKDFDEYNVKFGDKLDNLRDMITYLQCRKSLVSRGIDVSVMDKLFFSRKWDELNAMLGKYKYSPSVVDNGLWRYFNSDSFENYGLGFGKEDVKHRLYLDILPTHRAYFSKLFMEECARRKVPYFFKVLMGKAQTDTIVIYVDTDEHLASTCDIINKIYSEHKDLSSNTKEPAPHLCKLDDFLGYGFNPPKINGSELSYTQFMKKFHVSYEKINELRFRILNDSKNGKVYSVQNGVAVPSVSEFTNFNKLERRDQYLFFRKYFPYFLAVYGNEINYIASESERIANEALNSYSSGSMQI